AASLPGDDRAQSPEHRCAETRASAGETAPGDRLRLRAAGAPLSQPAHRAQRAAPQDPGALPGAAEPSGDGLQTDRRAGCAALRRSFATAHRRPAAVDPELARDAGACLPTVQPDARGALAGAAPA